ncbi:hypothetical protein Tco_0839489 [Tanacetum coccineum]|uniref:Uncharacterized protein n=1 Tax=Tanacetum coccineum TaxID=301880 RepID=A0ABQ5ATC6_9ASTR
MLRLRQAKGINPTSTQGGSTEAHVDESTLSITSKLDEGWEGKLTRKFNKINQTLRTVCTHINMEVPDYETDGENDGGDAHQDPNTSHSEAPDTSFELITFSDVDHAGYLDTYKSTSGGIQFLGDKLVSWSSKKQDCTAMSTAEA